MIKENHKVIIKKLFLNNHTEFLHSLRVASISYKIGKAIGLTKERLEKLELAALLHDVGKTLVPLEILNKETKLELEEYEIIKSHTQKGYDILNKYSTDEEFLLSVLEHHERWDGKGYPKNKTGEEISLFARIIAIADTYDAIISDRPYRKRRSKKEAILEIEENVGKQFDPEISRITLEKVLLVT